MNIFTDFLSKFTQVTLPLVVSPDTYDELKDEAAFIPDVAIQAFLLSEEDEEVDEFTEFMPCYHITSLQGFIAIVYWRGDLSGYQYKIVTYSQEGHMIDSLKVGGVHYNDKEVTHTASIIDENGNVYIKGTVSDTDGRLLHSDNEAKGIPYKIHADGSITLEA